MKDKKQILETIEQTGLVCIIRMDNLEWVRAIAQALYAGGVKGFEVPMTAPNADAIIRDLRAVLPQDAAIGAGTVLTAADAAHILGAGAQFVVSPHYVPEVGEACKAGKVAFIPGAFSPMEVYAAHQGGADIVKVFSIRPLGPEYLKDLAGPYPGIRFMPTGGITLENAVDYIRAGAVAVTVGRDIIGAGPWDKKALSDITERAKSLTARIQAHKTSRR